MIFLSKYSNHALTVPSKVCTKIKMEKSLCKTPSMHKYLIDRKYMSPHGGVNVSIKLYKTPAWFRICTRETLNNKNFHEGIQVDHKNNLSLNWNSNREFEKHITIITFFHISGVPKKVFKCLQTLLDVLPSSNNMLVQNIMERGCVLLWSHQMIKI